MSARPYDIVIWGATGFTGQLAAKYLAANYGNTGLRWAISGRDSSRLATLKECILKKNPNCQFEVIIANLDDESTLNNLASNAKVILSTAGPYSKLGTPIVDACVRCGTNYVDLTAETHWIRSMIDKHNDEATKKKIKIVSCCGFDSIPSELGAMMIANALLEKNLVPEEIRYNLGDSKGGWSGGTVASVFEIVAVPNLKELSNPFYLNPRDPITNKPQQPSDRIVLKKSADSVGVGYDNINKSWTFPFIMQFANTRVVNRSNALLNWKYGKNLIYSERVLSPVSGVLGLLVAMTATATLSFFGTLAYFSFTRRLLKMVLPSPGQGPSEAVRESGFFRVSFWGTGRDASGRSETVFGGIKGMNGDPGYKQTAAMICESALSIVYGEKDESTQLPYSYGVVTPSVAFGKVLLNRLEIHSGIHFFFLEESLDQLKKKLA